MGKMKQLYIEFIEKYGEDSENWSISPEQYLEMKAEEIAREKEVMKEEKAIMYVNLYGDPADFNKYDK